MTTYTDANRNIDKGYSQIETKSFESKRGLITYTAGNVYTPYGIVAAYSQENYSALSLVWRGRRYDRTWRKEYTPRTLAKLAKRFAKDITQS
jgi:hypothetical protein